MRRLLKYTAMLLMVLMACSAVWAYDYTDHVTTAPNHKGDVLIYPWYMALDGGWQTKLTVINTSLSNAVVAKVVIRSFKNSEELLDFFIYLSPSDVWTGTIKKVGTTTVIFSNDDSVLYTASPLVFANTTPINQPMFALDCADDADYLGYVEVIMAAYKPGISIGTTKDKIFRGFRDTTLQNQGGAPVTTAGSESIGTMYFPYSLVATTGIDNPNSLTGYMELQNAALGLSTSLAATTLKDYDTDTKLTTSDETRLGELSRNSYAEVEAALSKNHIALPYVNGNNTALHFLTFPTKLTQRISNCKFLIPLSPYFEWNVADLDTINPENTKWCVQYALRPFDLTEKTPSTGPFSGGGSNRYFCNEVNFLASSAFEYAEGWAYYFFSAPGDSSSSPYTEDVTDSLAYIDYHGAPVIPTFLYIGDMGLLSNYGAWSDTLVHGLPAFTELVDYQYTDSAVPTI